VGKEGGHRCSDGGSYGPRVAAHNMQQQRTVKTTDGETHQNTGKIGCMHLQQPGRRTLSAEAWLLASAGKSHSMAACAQSSESMGVVYSEPSARCLKWGKKVVIVAAAAAAPPPGEGEEGEGG